MNIWRCLVAHFYMVTFAPALFSWDARLRSNIDGYNRNSRLFGPNESSDKLATKLASFLFAGVLRQESSTRSPLPAVLGQESAAQGHLLGLLSQKSLVATVKNCLGSRAGVI